MTDHNKEPQEGTEDKAARIRETAGAYKDAVITYQNIMQERHEIETGAITQSIIDLMEQARESVYPEETGERIKGYTAALMRAQHNILKSLKELNQAHAEYIQSEEWQEVIERYPDIEPTDAFFIAYLAKDLIEYEPEIKEIYKEYQEQEGQEIPFRKVLYEPAPDDIDTGLIDYMLIQAQRIREEKRGELPRVTARPVTKADLPLDKVNALMWSLLEEDTNGQLTFAMETKKGKGKKKKQELNLTYSIDFNALEEEGAKVSKRLTPTDKRVYVAIAALFNAGNEKITLEQIHRAMGGTTPKPAPNQKKRINESVYKMARAWITIDDTAEHEAYNYDIDEHRADKKGWTGGRYDGPLLPIERGQTIVNGKLADAAIHLFREPPMLTFAKLKNQITTIDIKLLQSPANKTDGNLLIEDYLLTRITRAKNTKGRKSEKILFKTLFDKAGVTDKKQRQRAPGKIEAYLKYYQQEGFIKSYTMELDSVTIHF